MERSRWEALFRPGKERHYGCRLHNSIDEPPPSCLQCVTSTFPKTIFWKRILLCPTNFWKCCTWRTPCSSQAPQTSSVKTKYRRGICPFVECLQVRICVALTSRTPTSRHNRRKNCMERYTDVSKITNYQIPWRNPPHTCRGVEDRY